MAGQKKSANDSLNNCKKNSIYIELGGQGGVYSICYDRLFDVKEKKKNSFSIGFSYVQGFDNGNTIQVYALPFSRNTIFYRNLELGIGITPAIHAEFKKASYYKTYPIEGYTEITPLLFFSPKIGFRYQTNTSKLFFKATFTPMISFLENSLFSRRIYPWGGISIGHSF